MILKPCSLKDFTKTVRINEAGNKALKSVKLSNIKLSEGDVITSNLEELYEVLKKVNIIDELLGINEGGVKDEKKSIYIYSSIFIGPNLILNNNIEQINNNLKAYFIKNIKIENSRSNDPREIYYVQFYSGIETIEENNSNFGFSNIPKINRGQCFSTNFHLKSKEELINLCWDILLNGIINSNNLDEKEKKLINNETLTKIEKDIIHMINETNNKFSENK